MALSIVCGRGMTRMKIVVLEGYAANPGDIAWDEVAALGELTVYDRTPQDQVAGRIAGAQIVLVNKTQMTREIIFQAESLRYIGELATGYNNIDIAAARERGVVVTNIPGYSTMSVAQHVFALLLEITQHVGLHSASVHAGEWVASPDFVYWKKPLMELDGKVMGLVGAGAIGGAVAKIADAMGMRVLASSRSRQSGSQGPITFVPLEQLLEQSDVISLHCPLTPQTQGLIGRENIAKMKDGVILINTARGPVVDEHALAQALKSGKIYAAGIDVISQEPMARDNPLLGIDNCIITPHIAWAPLEARQRLMKIAAGNIRAYLAGRPENRIE